jgi:two-component system response regulator YesN
VENKDLLRILLVDDEPFIRKGLAALIDWEAEGYCIANEAENGAAAIQLLKEEKYDLIISDIKMPEIDGIDLMKYVKTNKLSTAKFIFLSGYYEFQYAKAAIQYDCCDYILKPVQKEELLTTLRKIIEEHRQESGIVHNKRVCEKAYLDRNLMSLLWGKFDDENLQYVQENLQLSEEVTYVCVEILLKDEKFMALPEAKKREQQRKLYRNAGLLLKKQSDHVIFDVTKYAQSYDIGLIFCTCMAGERNMSEEDWFDWFLNCLSQRMEYKIAAYVGSKVKGIAMISDSYREATVTRSFCLFQRQDDKQMYTADKNHIPSQDNYFRKELDHLIHVIEIGDKKLIEQNVKEFYNRMMDNGTDSELIGLNIHYFLYRLLGLAYEQEPDINQEEVMHYIRDAAFSLGIMAENEAKFRQFSLAYADYLMQLRQSNVKGVIRQIEEEIEENYADNISLKSLSEKYYINCAYLGQVFKRHYKTSFKDYLNGVRVRKAAEILLRSDEKVYEVAEKVGYKNLEYFVMKFQNAYGVTPARFRKKQEKD